MPPTIVVRLTVPQARAACRALGFALAGEALEVFGAVPNYQAARRAHAALSAAVDAVDGWEGDPDVQPS